MIEGCTLPMPGDHNVRTRWPPWPSPAISGHRSAPRSARRWRNSAVSAATCVGEVNGVTIIDDYGHHPSRDRRRAEGPRQPPRAASSPSTSRTAIRGCRTRSRISAPASTGPDVVAPSPEVYSAGGDPSPRVARDDLLVG